VRLRVRARERRRARGGERRGRLDRQAPPRSRQNPRIATPSGLNLQIRPLLRDVLRVYRRHWKLLVPLSVVVLAPQAIADAALGEVEVEGVHTLSDIAKLAEIPIAVGINLGGEALFAGIVAVAVLAWRRGGELQGLREIVPTIPIARLIGIDFLLVIATAAGFALFVIPGVLVYTYFVISPTLVEIQHIGIRAALRRSFELVRGNFWRVLGVSLFFAIATDGALTALATPFHGIAYEAAFHLAIEAAIEPFQALATVLMAIALVDIHKGEPHT
jgi:hypothetical protein